ncbi:putative ankyrin repeat- containing protein [Acanthamoeba polyphaga mimivirus]|nr:ankyrin repeat-containing protein [Acanthamoeba castellanii mamavirus]UMZ08264.1 putative ankyrin repeat- containing protein [Acanthamoeba polyphaga mimivirus]
MSLEGKIFYLLEENGTSEYPLYKIIDKTYILSNIRDVVNYIVERDYDDDYSDDEAEDVNEGVVEKATITKIQLDFSNPKFVVNNFIPDENQAASGIYYTNSIIKIREYDLYDENFLIELIEESSQSKVFPENTCKLYRFGLNSGRFNLCDILIQKGIKYKCTDHNYGRPLIVWYPDNGSIEEIYLYLLKNMEYFKDDFVKIIQAVAEDSREFDVLKSYIEYAQCTNIPINYHEISIDIIKKYHRTECIKLFIEMGLVNSQDMFHESCLHFSDLTGYLVDQGVEFNFSDVFNFDLPLDTLEYFAEKGFEPTNEMIVNRLNKSNKSTSNINNDSSSFGAIMIMTPNYSFTPYKPPYYSILIEFLLNHKYLKPYHINQNVIDKLIEESSLIELVKLDKEFDIKSYIDLNILMKKAVDSDIWFVVKHCIENGINIDECVSYALNKSMISIVKKLKKKLGATVPDNFIESDKINIDDQEYIQICINKGMDLTTIYNEIILNGSHKTLKYIANQMIQQGLKLPKITNTLIYFKYQKYPKCDKHIKVIRNLNIDFTPIQRIILAINDCDIETAKYLISQYQIHDNLKILLMSVISHNIEFTKYLIEVNNFDKTYTEWAIVLAAYDYEMFMNVLDYTSIDINTRQQEIILMLNPNDFNVNDTIDYLHLMEYPNIFKTIELISKDDKPIYKFLKKFNIEI